MKPVKTGRGLMQDPIVPFYVDENDVGCGIPSCCGRCEGPLILKPIAKDSETLSWMCEDCGLSYGY